MPVYNPLVPTGTVPLNIDYQNLQGNFATLNTIYNTDHVPLTDTSASKGYHNTIHSVPFSTTSSNPPNNQPVAKPTSVVGVSEIFTAIINDGISTASALYFQSDTGLVSQLTRNFNPFLHTNGYTYLPGGIILQWGKKTTGSTSGTINFNSSNISFTNNCWQVLTIPFYSGTAPTTSQGISVTIDSTTLSKLSFDWTLLAGGGAITGFYWMAIGN
jgi:hypothetical protein